MSCEMRWIKVAFSITSRSLYSPAVEEAEEAEEAKQTRAEGRDEG